MPTMPIFTATDSAVLSDSGSGSNGSQWGPSPPGSIMCPQIMFAHVGSPSDLWPASDCPTGQGVQDQGGGCCTSSCGCEKCESEESAIDPPWKPELLGGPGRVNPANGNAVFHLGVPDSGLARPDACSWYNAKNTNSDELGYGWGNSLRRWLEEPSGASADIYKGDGTVLHFTGYRPDDRRLHAACWGDE